VARRSPTRQVAPTQPRSPLTRSRCPRRRRDSTCRGDPHLRRVRTGRRASRSIATDVMVWSQDVAYMPALGGITSGTGGSTAPPPTTSTTTRDRYRLSERTRNHPAPRRVHRPHTVPGEDWYWFDYGTCASSRIPPARRCVRIRRSAGQLEAPRGLADDRVAADPDDPLRRQLRHFRRTAGCGSRRGRVGSPPT